MVPAGEAAANVFTLVVAKDPSDPAYADDPDVKQYIADVGTYGPGVDAKVGNVFTGYNGAFLTVDALTRAAKMDGGLTRANLMNAFWSFNTKSPIAIGGVAKVDGVKDAYIAEYGVMAGVRPDRADVQGGRRRQDRRRGSRRSVRRLTVMSRARSRRGTSPRRIAPRHTRSRVHRHPGCNIKRADRKLRQVDDRRPCSDQRARVNNPPQATRPRAMSGNDEDALVEVPALGDVRQLPRQALRRTDRHGDQLSGRHSLGNRLLPVRVGDVLAGRAERCPSWSPGGPDGDHRPDDRQFPGDRSSNGSRPRMLNHSRNGRRADTVDRSSN
jgi:hypothetical protein